LGKSSTTDSAGLPKDEKVRGDATLPSLVGTGAYHQFFVDGFDFGKTIDADKLGQETGKVDWEQ
jgi:hypothetical protein